MKQLGFILVALGFLAGAFLASLDPDEVNWMLFVPVLLAGALGAWLVARAGKQLARSDEVLTANQAHIAESLEQVALHLTELDARKDQMSLDEIREEIDAKCRDELTRFVDARESLTHIYGLQTYADIMNAFAAGERYLNRVWSAAADGYGDEARSYIARAHTQFEEARAKLAQAQANAGVAAAR